MIRWTSFDTPFGRTFAAATSKGLLRLTWDIEDPEPHVRELRSGYPLWGVEEGGERMSRIREQIGEYFCGERRDFDLPLDLNGVTPFQDTVLRATAKIPFGATLSYKQLARRIDRPRASRAVGGALGRNPVPVVIPCHRVIRSDGAVGGYTAGPGYKEQLLDLERRLEPQEA